MSNRGSSPVGSFLARSVTVDTSRRITGFGMGEEVPVTYEYEDGLMATIWMSTENAVAEVLAHAKETAQR